MRLRGSAGSEPRAGTQDAGITEGWCLVDVGINDVWQIVDQQVFAAFTVELRETEAVAGAKDSFGRNGIGEAKARREIQLGCVDQSAVEERSAGCGEELL